MSDNDQPKPSPSVNPSGCWPKSLIDANKAAVEAEKAAALPAEITFADFQKVDIRSGQVLSCERVPKSDKLLKLQVDFGDVLGQRQILAGVGLSHPPEALAMNFYLFVVNLAPRKMMGLESHGMMLASGESPDKLDLVVTFIPKGHRLG